MGQARATGQMTETPQNFMGGTMLDQNMQAPGIDEAQLNAVAALINGFAQRFQGGQA